MSSSDIMEPSTSGGSSDTDAYKICNFVCVAEKIASIYADRLLSDVCLVINGVEYPAHRLILCASSEVFQIMLMNPQWTESQESRIELSESPECAKVFDLFLRFFYTGQITLHYNSLLGILMLADKYNVKDLLFICLNYMKDRIAQAGCQGHIVTWLQYALSMTCLQLPSEKISDMIPEIWKDVTDFEIRRSYTEWDHLLELCKNYIKWNFEIVAETQDFLNLQPEVFAGLLQQNDIVVINELMLYNYATKWIENYKNRIYEEYEDKNEAIRQYSNLVESIMCHVRFPMISARELAHLLLSPLVNEFKDFFIPKMAVGIAFHSGEQTEQVENLLRSDKGRLLFTPRLYTTDNWCSSIIINNFRIYPPYQSRTLLCTTPTSIQEYIADYTSEWVVDLYPKGLWFQKGYLISWHGTSLLPEEISKTVRLSVTCKNPPEKGDILLKIGILMYGQLLNVEHVMEVAYHTHTFSKSDCTKVIRNLLPFSAINDSHFCSVENYSRYDSPFLVGPNKNLKLQIILMPLCRNLSLIEPAYNSSVKIPDLPV